MIITAVLMSSLIAYVIFRKRGHLVLSMFEFHTAILLAFFLMYSTLPGGFESHFNVPKIDRPITSSDILYYSFMTQTTNSVEMYPKTLLARALVSAHVFFTVLAVFHLLSLR
jgi:hypothetical protein